MNLSRCQKGHFYDAEKYSSCPHCAEAGGAGDALTAAFTEDATVPESNIFTASAAPQGMPVPPVPPVSPVSPAFPVADIPVDQVTVPISGIVQGESLTVPLQPFDDDETEGDHTVGFYDGIFSEDSASTAPVSAPVVPPKKINPGEPCVGWLVALGGKHLGTDYRLKVGKNFIGRSPQMDVALVNDKSVSREKHAIVVYEPKEHLYLVQPGEASTLVYKNESVVLEPVKLEAYDVITVGEVNLLFIPLCNKEFNWSDLFDEMKKNG